MRPCSPCPHCRYNSARGEGGCPCVFTAQRRDQAIVPMIHGEPKRTRARTRPQTQPEHAGKTLEDAPQRPDGQGAASRPRIPPTPGACGHERGRPRHRASVPPPRQCSQLCDARAAVAGLIRSVHGRGGRGRCGATIRCRPRGRRRPLGGPAPHPLHRAQHEREQVPAPPARTHAREGRAAHARGKITREREGGRENRTRPGPPRMCTRIQGTRWRR